VYDECGTTRTMNAFEGGYTTDYYVNVGTSSGTISVDITIQALGNYSTTLIFSYGGTTLQTVCIKNYNVNDVIPVSIDYTYNSSVGSYIRVQATQTKC
jgi:hypothetical protein